jgi:hypothetical protein
MDAIRGDIDKTEVIKQFAIPYGKTFGLRNSRLQQSNQLNK